MVLKDVIVRNARRYPQKIAVNFGNTKYTFAEFNRRVNRLINALLSLGLRKGDRISVLADDCPEYIEIWWAAAKGGFVLVPLNRYLSGTELTYILNNSEPGTFFYGDNYQQLTVAMQPELKTVTNFISIGAKTEGTINYDELLALHTPSELEVVVEENDLMCISYTSGTTGFPKGVMLTQKNLVALCVDQILLNHMQERDVVLSVLPYCQASFPYANFPSFYAGCTFVGVEKPDANTILETIDREKITMLFTPSRLLINLVAEPRISSYRLSSLRRILYAGEPAPEATLRGGLAYFGNIIAQGYGLSECMIITYLSPEEYALEGAPDKVKRLASCGREAINTELRVIDENGNDVAPGEVGEIIAKGDELMMGYWKMPEATAQAIRNGYIYTGDMATLDEDGYVYLTGRKKDMIISGGNKFFPREIEEVIYHHPSVLEVAVVGIPDEKLGEVIKAFVIPKEGKTVKPEEIVKFCQKSLPEPAVPRSVEFVTQLPKNPMGKVLRRVLKDEYLKERP